MFIFFLLGGGVCFFVFVAFLVKICIFMHIFGTFEGTTLTHRGKRQCFFS